MIKKTIITLLLTAIFVGVFPYKSLAAPGPYYGGLSIWQFPCTCQGGALWAAVFAPLYIPIPAAGILIYTPGSFLYSYYLMRPGSFVKGLYSPVPMLCQVGVPPFCYQIPNLGYILPYSGTSI